MTLLKNELTKWKSIIETSTFYKIRFKTTGARDHLRGNCAQHAALVFFFICWNYFLRRFMEQCRLHLWQNVLEMFYPYRHQWSISHFSYLPTAGLKGQKWSNHKAMYSYPQCCLTMHTKFCMCLAYLTEVPCKHGKLNFILLLKSFKKFNIVSDAFFSGWKPLKEISTALGSPHCRGHCFRRDKSLLSFSNFNDFSMIWAPRI